MSVYNFKCLHCSKHFKTDNVFIQRCKNCSSTLIDIRANLRLIRPDDEPTLLQKARNYFFGPEDTDDIFAEFSPQSAYDKQLDEVIKAYQPQEAVGVVAEEPQESTKPPKKDEP